MHSCIDNEPAFAADAKHPGTNYVEVALQAETLTRIANSIAEAHAFGADLVVISNHWGASFVERLTQEFRSFTRQVIELGADIYYGHSVHICQGIEIHKGNPSFMTPAISSMTTPSIRICATIARACSK